MTCAMAGVEGAEERPSAPSPVIRDARLEICQTATEADPTDASARAAYAEALFERGDRERAIAQLQEFLELRPESVAARNALGHLLRRAGRRVEALAAFEAVVAAEPKNPWFLCAAAGELLALGRVDEAHETYSRAAARNPALGPAHNGLGHVARQRGRHDEALVCFLTAQRAEPQNPWFACAVAGELSALGRLDEAESAFKDVLATHPRHSGALNGLGQVHRARGMHEEALAAFLAASDAEPSNRWCRCAAAGEMLALGRRAEAIALQEQVLADDPNFAPALNALGLSLLDDAPEKALDAFMHAVRNEPGNAWYRHGVVVALRELGRLDAAADYARASASLLREAALPLLDLAACLRSTAPDEVVAALEEALAREPFNVAAQCALASEQARRWRLKEAEALFDAVLERKPGCADALVGKGLIARQREDRPLARALFERAAEGDRSAWAKLELAQELVHAELPDEARAALKDALRLKPQERGVLMQLGHLERALGAHMRAAAAFEAVFERFPGFVVAKVEASRERFMLGDVQASLAHLERALSLDPREPAAVEALADLLVRADRLEDALQLLEGLLARCPRQVTALLAAARLETRLGRIEGAMTRLNDATRVAGRTPEIAGLRAELLQSAGFFEDADRELDGAIAAFPSLSSLRKQRAILSAARGEREAAKMALETISASGPRAAKEVDWVRAHLAAARFDFDAASRLAGPVLDAPNPDPSRAYFVARASLLAFRVDEARRRLAAFAAGASADAELRGVSSHPTQSHYGHLLNEWRLDEAALKKTQAALGLAGAAQIAALAETTLAFEDYTPAAIALMIALRRQSRLSRTAEDASADPIPRRIIQFWDEEQAPDDVEALAQTWRRHNVDFEYCRFSARTARNYLRARHPPPVLCAFDLAAEPAQKADVFRLAFLAADGGYYADADDRCVGPVGTLNRERRALLVYQEDIGSIGNDFLGAKPRHPIIIDALAAAVCAIGRGDRDLLWLSTGPGLVTRIVACAIARNLLRADQDLCFPAVLDRADLFRAVRIHCPMSYKHTARHWSRSSLVARQNGLQALLGHMRDTALAGLEASPDESRRALNPQSEPASAFL